MFSHNTKYPLVQNQVQSSLFLDFFICKVFFALLTHFLLHLGPYSAISLPYGVFLLHCASLSTFLSPVFALSEKSKSLVYCCIWVWF